MADEKEAPWRVKKTPVASKWSGKEIFPRYFRIVLSMMDLLKESFSVVSKGFWQKRLAVKVVIFKHSDQTRQQKFFLHVLFVFNRTKEYAW